MKGWMNLPVSPGIEPETYVLIVRTIAHCATDVMITSSLKLKNEETFSKSFPEKWGGLKRRGLLHWCAPPNRTPGFIFSSKRKILSRQPAHSSLESYQKRVIIPLTYDKWTEMRKKKWLDASSSLPSVSKRSLTSQWSNVGMLLVGDRRHRKCHYGSLFLLNKDDRIFCCPLLLSK